MSMQKNEVENTLISAIEVGKILGISRAQVDRIQLKRLIHPVPTIEPKYYFNKQDILIFKNKTEEKSR